MNTQQYAVVTGASRGLGKALAIELAKRHINTLLISSSEHIRDLNQLLIDQYHVDSHYFITDLTNRQAIIETANHINEHYSVYMLINNSGLGGSQKFEEADLAYIEKIIQLNICGTTILTKSLIHNLLRQPQSYLLNVASMAAIAPTAYKTVYPASKAYLYSLSMGLHAEYKKRGLHVSVVCPGAMATSPEICARIERQGFWGKLTLKSPERIARKCISGLLRGRREIVVTPFSWLFAKIVPNRIKVPILSKIVRKEAEK